MSQTKKTHAEGLLAAAAVRLYGRPFDGLVVGELGITPGANNPLATSLGAASVKQLARIYAFGYQGDVKRLAQPVIVLLTSDGAPVAPIDGMADDNLMVWTVDRLDMVVRIDVQTGTLDDMVLGDASVDVLRSDTVGRDGNLVGRDGNLIGRDGNLIGRDGNLIGRDGNLIGRDGNLIGR